MAADLVPQAERLAGRARCCRNAKLMVRRTPGIAVRAFYQRLGYERRRPHAVTGTLAQARGSDRPGPSRARRRHHLPGDDRAADPSDRPAARRAKHALLRLERPPSPSTAILYDAVGEPWLWTDRRQQADDALAGRVINAEGSRSYRALCRRRSRPAIVELDRRPKPDVRIAYFGLVPIGCGGAPILNTPDAAWLRASRLAALHPAL